jgi:chemotaxis protein methyltransferase CheR
MWPRPPTLELPPNVFKILGDLIHERTGLHYDDHKRDMLAEKLSPLAIERGFGNFLDFYYLLKYGPNADEQWPRVIDALSVQETYFWREYSQIEALVTQLVPRYAAQFPGRAIRIWCAACASGEEPLSIAMALHEAGWYDKADIQILASDASWAALVKARRGIYGERSFRALPVHLREKYFAPDPNGWKVREELLGGIHWSWANLVDRNETAPLVQVPFLFCRNVFIYFARDTIARTIRMFAQGMDRPGYLFVGASESLLHISDEFQLEEVGNAFVYSLQ